MVPTIISGILKNKNCGTHESHMWSCCPSAFSPDVGPSVVSDAGDPASPSAPATATMNTIAAGEKFSFSASGT